MQQSIPKLKLIGIYIGIFPDRIKLKLVLVPRQTRELSGIGNVNDPTMEHRYFLRYSNLIQFDGSHRETCRPLYKTDHPYS